MWVLTATAAGQAPELESSYEGQRVAKVLGDLGLTMHGSPEGRTIEYVRLVTADVFVPDEFWPDMSPRVRNWRVGARRHPATVFNNLHTTTRGATVRREVLLSVGDRYSEALVQESMRNLRGLAIFALVRIVAVEVPGKSTVGLLVYTRDLWSLRLEAIVEGTGGNFRLLGQLTERNLFGRNKRAAARIELRPDSFSVGELFFDHRLMGGTLQLSEFFDLIINRDSGKPEGALLGVSVGQPYYNLAQHWAYGVSARHVRDIVRRHDENGQVLLVDTDLGPDDESDPGCDEAEPTCVRYVYADRATELSLAGHYRHGESWKLTYTLGAAFTDRTSQATKETSSDAVGREAFEPLLPVKRRQVYPYLQHRVSTPRYGVFYDLGTFGQSESVRLGPWSDLSLGLPLTAFGSTTDALFGSASLGYREKLGDGLLDLVGSASGRLEDGEGTEQLLLGRARGATPPWLLGRLVLYGRIEARRRSQQLVFLDGASGLRGYPLGSFYLPGGSRVLGTVEYRSLPLQIDSVQLGIVLFYDTGSLHGHVAEIQMHHSAGAGLRVLFPQFNRYAMRIDVGVPLDARGFAVLASFGPGQAIALTSAEDAAQSGDIRAR